MSFGTQTYGDETYGGSEFNISSISPGVVSRVGGTKITLTGTFPITIYYTVTVDGIDAYSGVSGQANRIYSLDGDAISFIAPALLLSQIGSVTVRVEAETSESVVTALDISEKVFGHTIYDMRRMFPVWYETGARRLELEPQEQ